jgi:hypothetical protein
MKRSFALAVLGGLAAGTALAWFRPAGTSSTGSATINGKAATVRPAKMKSLGSTSPLLKEWKETTASKGGFGQRLALMAMVMRASSEEMPGLLALSKDNAFARELLILRWVEIDAPAAGEWITPGLRNPQAGGPEVTNQDVQRVLTAWAKRDPDAALAKVKAEGGVFTAAMFQQQIIGSVLEEDMERGLKLMAESKSAAPPFMFGDYFDNAWVSKDPAKAARLLAEMPESDFRNNALVRAIGEAGAKDMAAGLALLAKFPALSSREQMWAYGGTDSRAGLFEKWAKEDMSAMIAFANDRAQGQTRSAMKEAIAKVIGEGDPKVAFAWAAENLSGQRRNNVVSSLISKLAKENPDQALEYLTTLPPGTALSSAANTFVQATRDENPAAALARIQALPDGAARTKLLGSTYLTWYQKEPSAALNEILRQPAESLPKEIWQGLGASTANVTDGLKQLEKIPAEHAPQYVRALFSRMDYNSDISEVAKNLDQLKEPAQRSQAIDAMVNIWSWRDPAGTVEWAAKLPNASERQLVRTILERRPGQFAGKELQELLAPLK